MGGGSSVLDLNIVGKKIFMIYSLNKIHIVLEEIDIFLYSVRWTISLSTSLLEEK